MNRLNLAYDIVYRTLVSWAYIRETCGDDSEEFRVFWEDRFMALLKQRKEIEDITRAIRYQKNVK